MATYTENYNLKKPTYAEPANVKDINDNMEIIDDVMHNTQISLADAYDQNETYNTGDIVMYEMLMYKCKEDNVTGAWNASKWERTTAGESGGGADLDIYGEASGTAEASFSDGAEARLVECEIGIVPTQDLHGYSKPWAGGAGKNKFNIDENRIGIDYDNSSSLSRFWQTVSLPNGNYTISFNGNMTGISEISFGKADSMLPFSPLNQHVLRTVMSSSNTSLTVTIDASYPFAFIGVIKSGGSITKADIDNLQIQIETGNTATAYEPYSNICPISGHTDVTVTVASTSGGSGEDTTVSLGRTVHGGTLDVTTGVLTVDKASSDLGDLSWVKSAEGRFQSTSLNGTIAVNTAAEKPNMICSAYEVYRAGAGSSLGITAFTEGGTSYIRCIDSNYASDTDFTNGVSGQTIVYKLATPQTFNLTPTQVETQLGQNYVSHDGGGTISLVYVKGDAPIKPNPADAEIPLTGLEIDGEKFKIAGGNSEVIPITAGNDTTSRTFAFSKTPKFIKFYWDDTVIEGTGWVMDAQLVWGQAFINYLAHARYTAISSGLGGSAAISYGADGKSITITGGNAFGAMNTSNGTGLMFVEY